MSRSSRSCTAGVRLKATYLLTDVGYAEGHHKILWYLPGESRVCRSSSVDLRNCLTDIPAFVPCSGTSALQTQSGGHQPRLASDSFCFLHTFLCVDTCGKESVVRSFLAISCTQTTESLCRRLKVFPRSQKAYPDSVGVYLFCTGVQPEDEVAFQLWIHNQTDVQRSVSHGETPRLQAVFAAVVQATSSCLWSCRIQQSL